MSTKIVSSKGDVISMKTCLESNLWIVVAHWGFDYVLSEQNKLGICLVNKESDLIVNNGVI